MKTRRELLKFFGVGTIIAPVMAGEVQAKLIEVPHVELVKTTPQSGPLEMASVRSVEVIFTLYDGRRRTMMGAFAFGKVGKIITGQEFRMHVEIDEDHPLYVSPDAYREVASITSDAILL